ncbi:urease accessory protein [Alteromonadaceae bacterium Bs31]|nr:urease accessory protein [Alteromonadaceae bacterium Bs31]
MLEAYEKIESETYQHELVASYEERKKSRHRTTTKGGVELGWFIERGHVLEHGECLKCSNGEIIKITAAKESVSEVVSQQALLLTRAAYHLGNRHVPLQVESGLLRYQHDHVLDEMVLGLGLQVEHKHAPFQPENGAYHGSGGHHHHHD